MLFRGPVHIAKQGEAAGAGGEEGGSRSGSRTSNDSWAVPFEVSIPLMPEESSIKRHAKSESYLPLDDASIATQVLPGSFACKTPQRRQPQNHHGFDHVPARSHAALYPWRRCVRL